MRWDGQINRREFTRNVARIGFIGALAALLGLTAKDAEAGYCYWDSYSYPVSACQSRQVTNQVCNGVIVRQSAGFFSNNNCAWAGKSPRCCG